VAWPVERSGGDWSCQRHDHRPFESAGPRDVHARRAHIIIHASRKGEAKKGGMTVPSGVTGSKMCGSIFLNTSHLYSILQPITRRVRAVVIFIRRQRVPPEELVGGRLPERGPLSLSPTSVSFLWIIPMWARNGVAEWPHRPHLRLPLRRHPLLQHLQLRLVGRRVVAEVVADRPVRAVHQPVLTWGDNSVSSCRSIFSRLYGGAKDVITTLAWGDNSMSSRRFYSRAKG
jgi:hypothetical protein